MPHVQVSMGVNRNSPENVIFMHKRIEQAFDRQEWCILVQEDGALKVREGVGWLVPGSVAIGSRPQSCLVGKHGWQCSGMAQ